MALITSTSLWGSASAVTTAQIKTAIENASEGDELRIMGPLNFSGTNQTISPPPDFTLSGDPEGSGGLNRTDVTAQEDSLVFTGSNRMTVSRLRITADDTGMASDFHTRGTPIRFNNMPNGFRMEYCFLRSDLSEQMQITDCADVHVFNTEFDNQLGWAKVGQTMSDGVVRTFSNRSTAMLGGWGWTRIQIKYNYFHHCPHEIIKNIQSDTGCVMPDISFNYFALGKRDGLDTTGGYKGLSASQRAVFSDNTLVSCFGVADFKVPVKERPLPVPENARVKHVTIARNKVFGCYNFIVLTTDEKLTGGGYTEQLNNTPGSDGYWMDAVVDDVIIQDNDVEAVNYDLLQKSAINTQVVNNRQRDGIKNKVRVYNDSQLQEFWPSAARAALLAYTPLLTETGWTDAPALPDPTGPDFAYGPDGEVSSSPTPPTITDAEIVPTSGMGGPWPVGTNFQITVTATGSPTPVRASTQWLIDDVVVSTALTYTATTATTTLKGRVTVSNSAGTSSAFTTDEITVTAAGALPAIAGDTLTLLATAPT